MTTTDPYTLRSIEYLSCLAFVFLFPFFWRYLNAEPAPGPARQFADWFRVPDHLYFHPGHAWTRADGHGVVTVGIDDFAQRLVGPVVGLVLPAPGDSLRQGGRALAVGADGKVVDVVAPISGTVVAVNRSAIEHPGLVNEDPYGRGWLLKILTPGVAAELEHLASGDAARAWIEEVSQRLVQTMSPEMGQLVADGGRPVAGFARAIDEEHWDEVARRFLLS